MILRNVSVSASAVCFVLALLSGCASTKKPVDVSRTSVAEPVAQPVFRMPTDTSSNVYSELFYRDAVIAYYRQQENKLTWFDSVGHISLGDSMIAIIRNVRYFGLLPLNFHSGEIEEKLRYDDRHAIERNEAFMTDSFFRLANDLNHGVATDSAPTLDSVAIQLLRQIHYFGGLSSSLKSMEPKFSQYHALKKALAFILDTTEIAIRERLMAGEVNDSAVFNTVQTIEVNLERWRREKDFSEEGRYLYVNVPSFMAVVVEGGSKVFESKVIVGAPRTPTPDITSKVECLVTYPYWNVPRKIAVDEYLPILQRGDTAFITRNNFDVLDRKGNVLHRDSIDWKKFNGNYFPVSLRQREGKENSLGVIKFVFDNPYAVFLHDTNAKGLFRNKVRAYSHGCIRVEKAVELGHYLLTGTITKPSLTLDRYLRQEQRQFLNLPKPVPIFIRYFTCEITDNTFYLYDDCYDMDKEVAECLYGSL